MIIHPQVPDHVPPVALTAVDEVRSAVGALLGRRHGTLRIADALATVAAELAIAQTGRDGAAFWLRQVAEDVRAGRLKQK